MAEAVVNAGIPVMAHIGLTPQLMSKLGGFRVQGKDATAGAQLLKDALALEQAGCFAIVLEAIPDRVAQIITERLQIPTIGIGAGPHCDGQNLVLHDMVGLVRPLHPEVRQALCQLLGRHQQGAGGFSGRRAQGRVSQGRTQFYHEGGRVSGAASAPWKRLNSSCGVTPRVGEPRMLSRVCLLGCKQKSS